MTRIQTQDAGQLIAELRTYDRDFEAIAEDAGGDFAALDDEQFNWHPSPGRWSVAECIDHLNAYGRLVLPRFEDAVEGARAKGLLAAGPFRHRFLARMFIRSMEPPATIKVKAPKLYTPAPRQSVASAIPEFLALQDALRACVRAANGLDLARIKLPSPVSPLLTLTLAEWFALTAAHERRHLWQARQVLDAAGFPRT
jgi:hypothetical protein